MRNTFWSLVLFVFQLSLLAYSLNLLVEEEELSITLQDEISHLQHQCLPGGSDHICRKGFILHMISWKYLHCPFSYPKATSNEMKTRILKFSLPICGESEKSPGEWKSYPLQYSDLENSMDCKIHGAAKSLTRLSDSNFHFQSGKKSIFLSFQWLALSVDTQRMGRNGERTRLNVVRSGRKESGMLDTNPGFAGKWRGVGGNGMRGSKCRQWWWLHSILKALIFQNCIN